MRYILLSILLLIACSSYASSLPELALENSYKYLDLREYTNRNDHPSIDRFLLYTGLDNRAQYKATGCGYSWCAAFVVYNYKEAADKLGVKQPIPRSAGVANIWRTCKENPIRYTTFTSEQVRMGLIKPQPGDLIIWKHGVAKQAFTTGHIGLQIAQITNVHLKTIEGNTLPNTSGSTGNQREGGGVYIRDRYLSSGKFYILGFIRPKVI